MRWCGVVCLVIVMTLLAGCESSIQPPFRVAHNGWPGYRPANLALDLGYIEPAQLHLVELGSASEVMRALRNQAVDAAALTLDEVLVLAQSGYPIKVVMALDVSDGGDAIIARPGIRSMQELSGRRVGLERNALGAYVLQRALETSGLKPQDVLTVNLELSDHEKAWLDARVDAIVTFDPIRTRLRAQGGNTLFNSKQIPGEIVDVLAVDDRYLGRAPETIRHFMVAWFKATQFLRDYPQPAARRLERHTGMSAHQFVETLSGLKLLSLKDNNAMLRGKEAPLVLNAHRLQSVMLAHGLQSAPVDIASLIDSRFLAEP